MNITYQSISDISLTMISGKPDLVIGQSLSSLNEGIRPTYGMTADQMGFDSFIMTINWS